MEERIISIAWGFGVLGGKLQSVQLADRKKHWEFRAGYVAKPAHASRIQML